MVVEVFLVVLVEAGPDHDGFGSVELFVAFAHEPCAGFVDEAAADEVLDVWVEGGAGACGVLRDVSGGAFSEGAHRVEDFPSDRTGERLHGLGVFDDEEGDGLGRGLVGHGGCGVHEKWIQNSDLIPGVYVKMALARGFGALWGLRGVCCCGYRVWNRVNLSRNRRGFC